MDRFWMRTVVGCLSASAIGVLSSACAHNDSTLFIQGVMLPPSSKTGGVCLYNASSTSAFQSEGVFDIGLASSYGAVLQLGNQMVQRGPSGPGSDPVHTETNRIVINGAEITVTDAAGAQRGNFTSVASSFVDVGSSGTAGVGIVGITAIDATTASGLCDDFPDPQIRKQLIVTVKAFGKTLGGTDVESQDFTYPVTVCKGCLVDRTSPCITPTGATPPDATKTPCQQGADGAIACAFCASSYADICVDPLPANAPQAQVDARKAKYTKACAARQ